MIKKIINSLRYIGLLGLALLSVIACERDFENIGVGLVDNDQFTTKDTIFEVIAYNRNIDPSRVDGIPQFLLGVYQDDNFGLLKTSFVSQLGLSATSGFGDDVSIDEIILDIPYYVSDTSTTGIPDFKLDSIIGNQNIEFNLSVYEIGTFLNSLDPLDPTKNKRYYSDEEYEKKALLYSGMFKPNRNDTILFVNRRFLDGDSNTIDDTDTIKKAPLLPSIKIPLDTAFFRNNFVNQQDTGIFDSNDNFIDYFRGIIVEADGTDGSLMTLAMRDAIMTIYYTNSILTDESGTDLNGDGDTDDINVPVRTKQTKSFPLFGVRTSQYIRDYSQSLFNISNRFDNPDMINGEDKLYIQGAAGSMAVIELFKGIDLNEIRSRNWLINEANLTFYVDNNVQDNDDVPDQLLLYRLDDNSQIIDIFTEVQSGGIGGVLETDDDNIPEKYKFRVTDYLSEVLKSDNPSELVDFGLKVFHSTDIPQIVTDTLINDFSWIAKRVVLKGNNLLNISDPKKLKLEIFYTINNE